MRLIDSDALIEAFKEDESEPRVVWAKIDTVINKIIKQPTIEVCDIKPIDSKPIECNEKKTVTKYVYLVGFFYEDGVGTSIITLNYEINHEYKIESLNKELVKTNNCINVSIFNYKLIRTYEEEIAE